MSPRIGGTERRFDNPSHSELQPSGFGAPNLPAMAFKWVEGELIGEGEHDKVYVAVKIAVA